MLFFLLEVFPEELSFLSFRQLIEFIISSSVCQELFSFCFQVSFKTRLLITRSNSSVVYQNFQLVSSIFYFLNFFSEIRVAFDCRNSHKVYQDCLSMSSTFWTFLEVHVTYLSDEWYIITVADKRQHFFNQQFTRSFLGADSMLAWESAHRKLRRERRSMSKRSGGVAAAETSTGAFCEWRGELYCPPSCLLFYFFSHTFGW